MNPRGSWIAAAGLLEGLIIMRCSRIVTAVLLAALCCTVFSACEKEDNPVVQASDYVSEERSELEGLGEDKENQLAQADAFLEEELG